MNSAPPQSVEAERALIGAALLDPESIPKLLGLVADADFYREAHRRAWAAFRSGWTDVLALADTTKDAFPEGVKDAVKYWNECVTDAVSGALANRSAAVVREKAALRRIISEAQAVGDAADGTRPAIEVALRMRRAADEVVSRCAVSGDGEQAALSQWMGTLARRSEGVADFVSTSYPALDAALAFGLAPRHLSVWMGRPGMGKTSMIANLARRVGAAGLKVHVYPLEGGPVSLLDMMVCAELRIPWQWLLKDIGQITPGLRERMEDAARRICANVTICGNPFVQRRDGQWRPSFNEDSVAAFEASVVSQGAKIVLVDLVEKMFESRRPQDIAYALDRLQRSCGDNAYHLGIFQQISRDVEKREDAEGSKRPRLSDAKNSGAYEECADLVCGLYRPKYYFRGLAHDTIEVEVLKQRKAMAAGAVVEMDFEGATCWIGNDRERTGAVEDDAYF